MALAKDWNEHWISIQPLRGGGQASAMIVRAKGDQSETRRFLKVLSRQKDTDRRARMYREVAAYRTLTHIAIPKLIDSNCDAYGDLDYKLYLVTELVPGPTIEDEISTKGALAPEAALGMSTALAQAIAYCHERDVLHRDLKPDNVILRDGDPRTPVIVDFGLSFNGEEVPNFNTFGIQELGNRFLRLPELAVESSNKRMPESDIAYCCALLYYVLTRTIPGAMLDASGDMPHQRQQAKATLAGLKGIDTERLMRVFDVGFQIESSRRWHSAIELCEALRLCVLDTSAPSDESTDDQLLSRIKQKLTSPIEARAKELRTHLEDSLKAIGAVFSEVVALLGVDGMPTLQSAYHIDLSTLTGRNSLGVKLTSSEKSIFMPTFHSRIVGSEVVISVEWENVQTELHRTPTSSADYGEPFRERLKKYLLRGFERASGK